MNHIVEDSVHICRGISALIMDTTCKRNLMTMVQISRPNWPSTAHTRAVQYLRSQSLRHHSTFSSIQDYLEHLDKELNRFNQQHPVHAQMLVADELTLSRWEARWRRMRQRPQQAATMAPSAIPANTPARYLQKVA